MPNRSSLFSSSWFNPWREINRLSRTLDNFMQSPPFALLGEDLESGLATQAWRPACDIDQTDTHYMISFDLPGVAREDVKIEVRDHQLYVSGERSSESRKAEGESVSHERYAGSFMRSFTIPESVKADQVQASLVDGVLRIAIPRGEAAQKKMIPIQSAHAGIFEKLLPHKKKEEKVA